MEKIEEQVLFKDEGKQSTGHNHRSHSKSNKNTDRNKKRFGEWRAVKHKKKLPLGGIIIYIYMEHAQIQ